MSITLQNWSHEHYQSEKLRAFISLCGKPAHSPEENETSTQIFYSLVISDHERKEIMQEDFQSLEAALEQINHRYGHWAKKENQPDSGGGCGSCSAH